MLERDSAAKRGLKHRLCYDIVKEAMASNKYSPLEKGRIRAFATEAFLTKDRALHLGYQVLNECQFCGEPESIFHRLWKCKAGCVQEVRCSLVDPEDVERALEVEGGDLASVLPFISGAFAHPADTLPKPASEADDGPLLVWHDTDQVPPSGGPLDKQLWGTCSLMGPAPGTPSGN